MSLILATGSNLNDPLINLSVAKTHLTNHFELIRESKIYKSNPVDYFDQPDFYNQVLEFFLPVDLSPESVMQQLLQIESHMGRSRKILKGPRIIDIDIIFWGNLRLSTPSLSIPHPRWINRSFVVRPLMELPFFQSIEKCFTIPKEFEVEAFPIN